MKTMPPKKEPPLNFDGAGVTGVVAAVVVAGSVVVALGVVGLGLGCGVVSGVAVVVSFAGGAAVVTVSFDGCAERLFYTVPRFDTV